MSENNKSESNEKNIKRKSRKKHRIISQVISYTIMLVILAIVIFGLYKGIPKMIEVFREQGEPIEDVISENMAELNENNTISSDSLPSEESAGVIATPDFDEDILNQEDSASENELDETEEVLSEEEAKAKEYIEALTTEQKVASLFIVTPEAITGVDTATQALEGTKDALSKYAVGGIVYSNKNVAGADKFKEMINNTKGYYNELYGIDVWTFVQEEGAINTIAGSGAGVVKASSAEEIGNSGDNSNAYAAYVTIASYLEEYNIDVNLGPVCSYKEADNCYLGNRAFSNDADIAASMVARAVDGQQEKGIITCLTAFPGEGDLPVDTANGENSSDKSIEDMKTTSFLPFVSGIESGAQMVMMSHLIAKNATGDDLPCSMSNYMISDILRGELGFKGVIITDDMTKKAITANYSSGEAAVMALNAGCDMIYKPENFEEAYNAVLEAVNDGTVPEERLNEALMKIYTVKFLK